MKKVMFVALASVIAFTVVPSMTLAASIPSFSGEKTQRVEYDGAIEIENHLFVPIREMFTELKAPLVWDSKNKSVTIEYKENVIKLIAGSTEALVNDKLHTLQIAPMMYKGRMYVSLQSIANLLSGQIEVHELDDIKLKYLWGYTFEKFYTFEEIPFMKLPYGQYSLEDAYKIVDRYAGSHVHADIIMEFKGMEGNSYLFHQYFVPGYDKIKDESLIVNTEKLIEEGLPRYIWNKYLVDKDSGQIRTK